jgi:biopolymer transport protein ExbD
MQVQAENTPYDDINVTPMLDLAYVLLVIFIIMTTASVQGIKVNLPKASSAPSLAKPSTKAITVDQRGQVFLDAYPVTMQELESRLRALKAANPALPVVIKGDVAVNYGKVMEVLELLGNLDITQLGLVTQRAAK